jgi:SSS family solute:Na+ symporter
MTLHPLDLAAVAGYFVLMAVLGFFTRRTKTFSEFAVGKHSVPAMMVFASLAATIVGPGFSVGVTSKSWEQGFLFYFLVVAFSVQILATGLLFAPRLAQHRDCNTLGDVMRKRYGRFAHLLTGILSVGLCVGFTAVIGKVGGSTLQMITGWPLAYCLIAVTGTTALLTFAGGLRATIATEGMQFSMIAIVIPITLILGLSQSSLSLTELSAKASELTSAGYETMTGWQMFGIAISFLLGEVLIPPYANRALAAKTQAASKNGFLMAGVFVIIWLAIVAAFGIVAHGVIPAETAPDDVFVTAGKALLPVGVFGLLLATIVAIVMSSQEACLNAAASSLVRDIVGVFAQPGEKVSLLLAKGGTLVLAALAIVFAHFSPTIIDGLLFLYAVWAPCIIVPLIAALFFEKAKPLAGPLSILGGGAASWAWQSAKEPGAIPAILVGVMASLICFFIGQTLGKPKQTEPLA